MKKGKGIGHIIRPLLIGLFVVAVFCAIMSEYIKQESKLAELEQANQELQIKKMIKEREANDYRDRMNNWQTDEYIEKIAREEFGLVRPGETIFVD